MRKFIFIVVLILTSLIHSQNGANGWTYAITIDTTGAGLTGTVLKLGTNEVPVAVWVDSLTVASTLSFDIIFGDTAGYSISSEQMWRTLTAKDDGSTDWTATLTDDKVTPLDPGIFYSLLGKTGAFRNQVIYLRPFLSAKQNDIMILYIRVRYI